MKILHLFPEDDTLISAHVAMLRERDEPFTGQPDIVHVHGCWHYSIVRQALRFHREGARIVMSPHGGLEPWVIHERHFTEKLTKTLLWQRRMVESAYVLIAHGPMEAEALQQLGWNPRAETIRNAVVTNSITPEAMRQHTREVYRKVMDSDTVELMDADSRRMLSILLKAGITGDKRWLDERLEMRDERLEMRDERYDYIQGDSQGNSRGNSQANSQGVQGNHISPLSLLPSHLNDSSWRQLLVYADHENVRAVVDRGLHVLDIRAPYIETNRIKSYLPTDYQLPKVENRSVVGIVSEMRQGPLTLRQFVELDRALRRDDVNDEVIVDQLTEKRLIRFFRHILQLLQEQTLLDEGFLPAVPINDKQTANLRHQLLTHLRI